MTYILTLNNVVYVASMTRNKISVVHLNQSSFTYHFNNDVIPTYKNDIFYFKPGSLNGIYGVNLDSYLIDSSIYYTRTKKLNII